MLINLFCHPITHGEIDGKVKRREIDVYCMVKGKLRQDSHLHCITVSQGSPTMARAEAWMMGFQVYAYRWNNEH